MRDHIVLNKKTRIELRVCQQFVKYFNLGYEKKYLEPELVTEDKEAPDCIAGDTKNSETTHLFEITKASPEEAKNMGRDGEHEFFSEVKDENSEYLKQAITLYTLLKYGKAMKYPDRFKSQLIILLEGANIEYADDDIKKVVSKIYKDRPWQEKFRDLGFKEIWYVSTTNIFKFYPL